MPLYSDRIHEITLRLDTLTYGGEALGRPRFQAARSHRVVAIEECPIVEPPLAEWLRSKRQGAGQGNRLSVRVGNTPDRLDGATTYHLKGVTLRVSDESFFQVNTALIETLIDLVLARCDPQPTDTVLDAYCGVGLFSRFLARRADRVIGVEAQPIDLFPHTYHIETVVLLRPANRAIL